MLSSISRLFSCFSFSSKTQDSNKNPNDIETRISSVQKQKEALSSSKVAPSSIGEGGANHEKNSSSGWLTRLFNMVFRKSDGKSADLNKGFSPLPTDVPVSSGGESGKSSPLSTETFISSGGGSGGSSDESISDSKGEKITKKRPQNRGKRPPAKGGKRLTSLSAAAEKQKKVSKKDKQEEVLSAPVVPAIKTNKIAQRILGTVEATDATPGSNETLKIRVVEKIGKGSFSEAFLTTVGGNQYVIMRPKSGLSQKDRVYSSKDTKHSRVVLSILNKEGNVPGVQLSGSKVINLTKFVTENRTVEDLTSPEEGELLPYYDRGHLEASSANLTKEQRVSVVNQLLTGSYHMMLQGVSHGDIKPENVFLKTGSSGDIQACHGDWGGARIFREVPAGSEEHSFAHALKNANVDGGSLSFNYCLNAEIKESDKLQEGPDAFSRLDEIAGIEMMRDHFALGESLQEVLFADPNIPLVTTNRGPQTCKSICVESSLLRREDYSLSEKEGFFKEVESRLNDGLNRSNLNKDILGQMLNIISIYCEREGLSKPADIQSAQNLLARSSGDLTSDSMGKVKGCIANFQKMEGGALKSSRENLNAKKKQVAEKRELALETLCNHYPEQASLVRGLVGMSSENRAERASIGSVIRLAVPEDQVQEIEGRPGANVELLNQRLELTRLPSIT
jgi:hypothetical protein